MPGHLSAAEAPEDLWTCHECGWTYPNHHPSAKHRRNHKKVCGSVPGFTPTTSSRKATPEPATLTIDDGASSDDASSDDETTPDKILHGKRGHHHTTHKQQTVAPSAGARAAKSLCVTHRSNDPCDEANNVKPAPLTERTFSGQDNRQALQSTGSTPNAAVKPQHVRRPSAHALQGVWVCRHCAWTYPNAHPSAKHRRKHKKRCPALVVTPRHVVGAGGSSDEASSDEENKRGDAASEKQETHETNISSTTSSLPSGLEAFLGRSDSKRELRELQDTIILLSPKPASRRNSFKSPRHRREGPSGFVSPRGSLKTSKAVNNNQAQELVAGTERKPEVVSDQENEDPVVLNLPSATIPTPRSIPTLENVLGASLADGRRSSSDELDFSNSDEETPSSPDSVLPVHLLLPITTPDEEFTEQPLHHHEEVAEAATAGLKLEVETEKNENTNEVDVKQDEHKAAPELPPLSREASPEVDISESYLPAAAAADQKDSCEVSSVNRCEPVDASPGSELQTTVAGSICVAKESEMASGGNMNFNFSVASSVVVKPAVETAVRAHVESSALDSDYAPEHASLEVIVVGGSSDSASVECEYHDVQDTKNDQILREKESVTKPATEKLIEGQSCKELDSSEIVRTDSVVTDATITLYNDFSQEARPELSSASKSEEDEGKEGDSKQEYANPLRKTDLEEASDKSGSHAAEESHDVLAADQSTAEASVEVVKEEDERDDRNPFVLSLNQLPVEVPAETVTEEEDRDWKASNFEALCGDQPQEITWEPVEEKEKSGIPSLSSEVPSPDQSTSEDVKEEDKDLLITPEVSSIDQSPLECTSEVEYKNLSGLSSELSVNVSAEVLADKEKDLPASNTEGLAPSESLVESNSPSTTSVSALQENTNVSLDPLNAAEVQPQSIDTLEFSSELTSIVTLVPTTATLSSITSPNAVAEDDLTSELSANEKIEEPLDMEPKLDETPSTPVGTLNLNFDTLPTPKSQVVVTGAVGDEDHQQAKESDQSESQETVIVEEKTASSVAIDSHLSVGKEEQPEAYHHSGAAEEECKEVHGYNNVDEESKDIISDGADNSQDKDVSTAEQQMTLSPEATSSLDSACSGIEDQVPVDELRSDLSMVDVEQQEASAEVCMVNTGENQLRELNEKEPVEGTLTEVVEVLEPSTINSGDVVAEVIIDKKIDDLQKEVQVVTETEESRELVDETISHKEIGESSSKSSLDEVPLNRISSPGSSSDIHVTTTEETGAAGSEPEEEKEEVAPGERQGPTAITPPVPEVADNEKEPAKQAGLFGSYKEKFNNPQSELTLNLKAKEAQPAMTRQPGSGKRKLLPSLCGTFGDSPVLKNKKQEMRIRTGRARDVQSDNEVPYKLTFARRATKRAPAESPPSSPQRAGGPGSPEGLVKERIETYERLIGKTRTFGPLPVPSPTHHKFSVLSGKPSSPHFRGLTTVTSHQQFEHQQPDASAKEQISAIAAHLHHVEPKDTTKVQDTGSAPEELLHEARSHLRHNNNNSEQDSSSTEAEDSSSQRISKVPLVLKEAAEHSLSPVPRLTKTY